MVQCHGTIRYWRHPLGWQLSRFTRILNATIPRTSCIELASDMLEKLALGTAGRMKRNKSGSWSRWLKNCGGWKCLGCIAGGKNQGFAHDRCALVCMHGMNQTLETWRSGFSWLACWCVLLANGSHVNGDDTAMQGNAITVGISKMQLFTHRSCICHGGIEHHFVQTPCKV